MIRQFIKPEYSHAPWKNPKYSPNCMCKEKTSRAKVLGYEATTADKPEKGKALMVVPSIAQRWNTFPLIAGFTTFLKILK